MGDARFKKDSFSLVLFHVAGAVKEYSLLPTEHGFFSPHEIPKMRIYFEESVFIPAELIEVLREIDGERGDP
jgi:hypothetical protein